MIYFRFYIALTQNMRMNAMQLAKESISGLSKVSLGVNVHFRSLLIESA